MKNIETRRKLTRRHLADLICANPDCLACGLIIWPDELYDVAIDAEPPLMPPKPMRCLQCKEPTRPQMGGKFNPFTPIYLDYNSFTGEYDTVITSKAQLEEVKQIKTAEVLIKRVANGVDVESTEMPEFYVDSDSDKRKRFSKQAYEESKHRSYEAWQDRGISQQEMDEYRTYVEEQKTWARKQARINNVDPELAADMMQAELPPLRYVDRDATPRLVREGKCVSIFETVKVEAGSPAALPEPLDDATIREILREKAAESPYFREAAQVGRGAPRCPE